MNQHTFINLIDPVKDKIYRLALRLLTSREAAEDATQDVILKLWSRNDKLKEYANLEAFAMTVTKNHCLDQLKLKQNNNLRIVHSNYDSNENNQHRQLEIEDELDQVTSILNMLPEQQKLIFQLRDVEQYDFAEIAEITNMNETAIRVALSRARKKIREELIKKHNYGIGKN
ncbi:sigma-70 family RNA polymerase sigma factor [Antarcticibacterium flavum]|uniref:Sigma-70 family RNA polymerase sigma factor n=1 Tax=Antarcticibacterium flavum TaxID=2058175 RepID=A0A5B7X839_9FLAO|nr:MULTISPECIES: sigma-70 family RNA polymerase sigma factor [Antarcticibacterium]MCM4160362.1 RNA polymerase subunit sigma-70 [Antarcticibacterium sp. W02-3]QCY71260.1 sigma-70 family RNA polymerase sigma factor [Antarcticibacterium flavum]